MILQYAFAGIPDVNFDFLSINHLTNNQRGPDLPKLTSKKLKLMQENLEAMNSLFKPNDSVVIFGIIRQLENTYAEHPDLEKPLTHSFLDLDTQKDLNCYGVF